MDRVPRGARSAVSDIVGPEDAELGECSVRSSDIEWSQLFPFGRDNLDADWSPSKD